MPSRPTIRVYVDGQNLFRRALKGTPHKWLDVARLCQQVLPRYDVTRIKYFTALVRPSPHDRYCGERQQTYLAALAADPLLEVHFGYFRKDVLPMPVHPWRVDAQGNPETVLVKRTLEKGSDVNLATHLVWDALHGAADAYAVLSNDSDLVTPIRMLRDLKVIDVGVLLPAQPHAQALIQAASWVRSLRDGNYAHAQFRGSIELPDGTSVQRPREW